METKSEKTGPEQAKKMKDPTMNWDDSAMTSSYANVCNVASTREEIILLFGTNQTWHAGQEAVTVNLNDRVILSAYTAKRLSALLNRVLSDHEVRFGTLNDMPGTRH
jgi:hypothetical protein